MLQSNQWLTVRVIEIRGLHGSRITSDTATEFCLHERRETGLFEGSLSLPHTTEYEPSFSRIGDVVSQLLARADLYPALQ